jgi:hypothetical protein
MSFVDASVASSIQGGAVPTGTDNTGSPGATGPGANMSATSAVVVTLGVAAAGLLGLGYLFRGRGQKLPPPRIDLVNALNVYWSWLLIDGTLKLVAYHYHGHKLAQAYLLVA